MYRFPPQSFWYQSEFCDSQRDCVYHVWSLNSAVIYSKSNNKSALDLSVDLIGEIKPCASVMPSRGEVFLTAGRQMGEFQVVDQDSGGSRRFNSGGHLGGDDPPEMVTPAGVGLLGTVVSVGTGLLGYLDDP